MTTTNKLVETITEGIQEKKGKNIVIADLSGIDGAIAQYFTRTGRGYSRVGGRHGARAHGREARRRGGS